MIASMTPAATTALRAAVLRRSIGNHAARRMIERAGIPASVYRLACQLIAAHRGGVTS